MPNFLFKRPWFTPGGFLVEKGVQYVAQSLIDDGLKLPADAKEVDDDGNIIDDSVPVGEGGHTTVVEALAAGKKPPIGDAEKAISARKAQDFQARMGAKEPTGARKKAVPSEETAPVRRRSRVADN
jgi:hypothetical protein